MCTKRGPDSSFLVPLKICDTDNILHEEKYIQISISFDEYGSEITSRQENMLYLIQNTNLTYKYAYVQIQTNKRYIQNIKYNDIVTVWQKLHRYIITKTNDIKNQKNNEIVKVRQELRRKHHYTKPYYSKKTYLLQIYQPRKMQACANTIVSMDFSKKT